jgi:hypothetical protein
MPPRSKSSAHESYKLKIELMPLFSFAVPERSRKRLAKRPPTGPLFTKDVEERTNALAQVAAASPLVFVPKYKIREVLRSLDVSLTKEEISKLAIEMNAALLNYGLRLEIEQKPLSSWFPRFQEIVLLLSKVRALLPHTDKDDLLFNIIRGVGESYAASHGPHQGMAPYELVNPLDNFPYPVNYRSDEILERAIRGIGEVVAWMRPYLDVDVTPIVRTQEESLSAAVWLIGSELPSIYERAFRKRFGISLSSKRYGPGIRFILLILDAAGIVSSKGKKYSAITIKTYRRRIRKVKTIG